MTKLLPCPFCGSENIDPEGWASTERAGPACDDCAGTADTVEIWNTRPSGKSIEVDIGAAAEALQANPELCAMMNEMVGGPALIEAQAEIERLQTENKTLFEEHRIAMNLLRENMATIETVDAERDKWKQAYEDAKALAVLAIQR